MSKRLATTVPAEGHHDDDRRMSRKEAAEFLDLSEQTLRKWACQRRGPAFVRLGRAVRYSLADLRDFLDRSRIDHAA